MVTVNNRTNCITDRKAIAGFSNNRLVLDMEALGDLHRTLQTLGDLNGRIEGQAEYITHLERRINDLDARLPLLKKRWWQR